MPVSTKAGITWFPMSPGAPRKRSGAEKEGFMVATWRPLEDLSKTLYNLD
jgi:hypothetical protein